jgi:hypothetical protein
VLEEVAHLEAECVGDVLGRATRESLYDRSPVVALADAEAGFAVFVRGTQGQVGAVSGLDALQALQESLYRPGWASAVHGGVSEHDRFILPITARPGVIWW